MIFLNEIFWHDFDLDENLPVPTISVCIAAAVSVGCGCRIDPEVIWLVNRRPFGTSLPTTAFSDRSDWKPIPTGDRGPCSTKSGWKWLWVIVANDAERVEIPILVVADSRMHWQLTGDLATPKENFLWKKGPDSADHEKGVWTLTEMSPCRQSLYSVDCSYRNFLLLRRYCSSSWRKCGLFTDFFLMVWIPVSMRFKQDSDIG